MGHLIAVMSEPDLALSQNCFLLWLDSANAALCQWFFSEEIFIDRISMWRRLSGSSSHMVLCLLFTDNIGQGDLQLAAAEMIISTSVSVVGTGWSSYSRSGRSHFPNGRIKSISSLVSKNGKKVVSELHRWSSGRSDAYIVPVTCGKERIES